jgi:hypothetical protein
MANQGYINIAGATSYRKATGSGTDGDPFIPDFKNPDLGSAADSPATSDAGSFSLIALFKRWSQRWTTFYQDFGTQADASSATGSLMARIRYAGAYSSNVIEVTGAPVTSTYPADGQIIVDTSDWKYLSLWIQNTGATAISSIKIEGAPTNLEFKYKYIAESSANYTTESGKNNNNQMVHLIEANGLPAIAASGEGWAQLWVATLTRVRVSAKTDTLSTSTTIQINATLMR